MVCEREVSVMKCTCSREQRDLINAFVKHKRLKKWEGERVIMTDLIS